MFIVELSRNPVLGAVRDGRPSQPSRTTSDPDDEKLPESIKALGKEEV
jgi:hypothetical protein